MWNDELGKVFSYCVVFANCGLLSPFLYAIYVDDLIDELRQSGYGLFIGHIFRGCMMHADDILLLSPSCFGLRKLIEICESFGIKWDIKFNPLKSQLAIHLVAKVHLLLLFA